jgi:hypothetical protein
MEEAVADKKEAVEKKKKKKKKSTRQQRKKRLLKRFAGELGTTPDKVSFPKEGTLQMAAGLPVAKVEKLMGIPFYDEDAFGKLAPDEKKVN